MNSKCNNISQIVYCGHMTALKKIFYEIAQSLEFFL